MICKSVLRLHPRLFIKIKTSEYFQTDTSATVNSKILRFFFIPLQKLFSFTSSIVFRFEMRPWRADGKFSPSTITLRALVWYVSFCCFFFKWFYLVFVRFDACCKMWTWRLKCEKLHRSEMSWINQINAWLTEKTIGLCISVIRTKKRTRRRANLF